MNIPTTPKPDLPFNKCMRRDWARGELASNRVLEYCQAAALQGADEIIPVSSHWSAKNAHRDLVAALGWPEQAPEVKWIMIPMGPKKELKPHPVICPVDTWSTLAAKFPNTWKSRIEGAAGSCGRFWRSIEQHPIVSKHPTLRKDDFDKTIAIGCHADGAPITKHEGLFTISWNSLHGSGCTLATRFVFSCIRKSQICEGTLEALWEYFAWAMNTIQTGLTPRKDWRGVQLKGGGREFASGWRGSCIQVRGDWEFFSQSLGLARWDNVANCCWVCKASINQAGFRWTDFGDGAGWRPTIRSHESWLAELAVAGKPVPDIFKVRGLRLEGVMIDVLHAVDQGLASHVIANIFVEIMALGHWGSTHKSRASGLQGALKSWYTQQSKTIKASKVQGDLTYERIKTSNDWPKLRAKAVATRHLAKFAAKLAADHNGGTLHDRRRLAVSELLVEFYTILEQGSFSLTPSEQDRIAFIGKTLLQLYIALAKEAVDSDKRAWKMTPKFHIFVHLCEIQSKIANPNTFWAYADEDLQRHIGEIAASCSMMSLEPMVLYKWALLVFDEDSS